MKSDSAYSMPTLNPWINFNGNAEEAFTFYKSVFGGEFTKVVRFKDIASDEMPVEAKEENKIMYIALPIGNNTMLIGNDVPEVLGRVNESENRSKILVSTESLMSIQVSQRAKSHYFPTVSATLQST